MIEFFIKALFLAFAFTYASLGGISAQNLNIPSDWKRVRSCEMSFFVPKDFNETDSQGVDSCVRTFTDSKTWLHIDYGYYGEASENDETLTGFREEFIRINGKKAQLATFRRDFANAKNTFVARIFVVVDTSEKRTRGVVTSLNMELLLTDEKDLEMARQIFQSIRFTKN